MKDDSRDAALAPSLENGPSEAAIREELVRILSNPDFKRKTTLVKFLTFIVNQSLAGRTHEIKGYTIATQVLGKADAFDAVKDPTVRILAGKLRSALDHYYLVSGGQDPVQIEVPKGTYVPVFHRRPPKPTAHSSAARAEEDGAAQLISSGVAVLPFKVLSGDPKTEHFAAGLREELLAELVRYKDFPVVPGHGITSRGHTPASVRSLGRELNVRFLVEGSVRQEGSCLKIAFGLVDTTSGVQIWGERYRREVGGADVIPFQEQIAETVAAKIADSYGIIAQELTRNLRETVPAAIGVEEAFVYMREYTFNLSEDTFTRVYEAVNHARQRHPSSGLVWAMLANLCCDDNTLGAGALGVPMERAMAFARKGARLEPQNQYVRAILAYQHFLVGDRSAFFREAETALALNPSALTLTAFLGWLMALHGEWAPGLRLLEKGIASNPHYPDWFHMAPCLHLYGEGRYLPAYHQALRIQMPRFFWAPLLRAAALAQLGQSAEARAALDELLALKPDFPADARRRIGYFVKSDRLIEGLLAGLKKAGMPD